MNKVSLFLAVSALFLWLLSACAPTHVPSSQTAPPAIANVPATTQHNHSNKVVAVAHKDVNANNKVANSSTKSKEVVANITPSISKVVKSDQAAKASHEDQLTCQLSPNLSNHSNSQDQTNIVSQSIQIPPPESKEQVLLDNALDYCEAAQELWQEGNLDQAISTLDHAYSLILKVNTDDTPQLIQQKDDIRFMVSKLVLEIHASRYTAVTGNHKAIPLTMNRHVEAEIKRFQGPEKRFFLASYKRSGRYRPMIVKMLKQAGMPTELSWLPLIESGFKLRAMSHARALGLWQFIPSTGYKFGLNRNTWVDERMDPVKSTKAAIAYLNELHQIFGDWTTVLAAYNCGEGAVLRVIRSQRVNYLDNFWDLYDKLPQETAQYVPKFLAVLQILKNPKKYGFDLKDPDPPMSFDTVTIDKQVSLREIAKVLNVPYKQLCQLNPALRYQVTPPDTYQLRVPKGDGTILEAKLDKIHEWCPPRCQYVWHRVQRGETLSLISFKYHSSIRSIVLANHLRRSDLIRVGQKLRIPLGHRRYPSIAYETSHLPYTYRVKKGDSLWVIARRFGTTTSVLMRINHLRTPRLHVGQILHIRLKRNKSSDSRIQEASAGRTYHVKPGDSLSRIARQKGVPLAKILRANNLTRNTTIHPGEIIILPE